MTPTGDEPDDALLKMSINQQESPETGLPDISSMTEEEQIAYAMQMSLQAAGTHMENVFRVPLIQMPQPLSLS